jgi:hypothetical protein
MSGSKSINGVPWATTWLVGRFTKAGGTLTGKRWDAIWRIGDATWWDWDSGLAPLYYWCWPKEYRIIIQDGLPIWFSGEQPCWQQAQQAERDETTRDRAVMKLAKVRKRKHISPGTVWSLTDFFSVPKGSDDIRLVYNGMSSGLNDVLWVPSFPMPTANRGHYTPRRVSAYMDG